MGVPHNQSCMGQGRVRWHTRLRGDGEVESGNGMEGRKGGGQWTLEWCRTSTMGNQHLIWCIQHSLTLSSMSSELALQLRMFRSKLLHRHSYCSWIIPSTMSNPAGQDSCIRVILALALVVSCKATLDNSHQSMNNSGNYSCCTYISGWCLTHISHNELMAFIYGGNVERDVCHPVLTVTWQQISCSWYEYQISLPE